MNSWKKLLSWWGKLAGRPLPQYRHTLLPESVALGRVVHVEVYLPPGYFDRPLRRYPLVLFNDGQDLPVMDFGALFEGLIGAGKIAPCVIVGVYASGERMREYGTVRQPDYKGRGDRAPQYKDFIIKELLPLLSDTYRLLDAAAARSFAGFSLGGLSAFDLAWAHPQVFGNVGVFSGALWWRWAPVHPSNPDADRILHDVVRQAWHAADGQRYWFQVGTEDETADRNHNGVIDAIDDTRDLIRELQQKGCPPHHIRYLEMDGGRHEPGTWAQAMPDFLAWALAGQ